MTTVAAMPSMSAALPEPMYVADLGIDQSLMLDLVLKTLFYRGRMTGQDLSDDLKVSSTVVQEVLQTLTQDGLVTMLSAEGSGPSGYIYTLTAKGIDRADAARQRNGYVGPAPVPLSAYVAQVKAQSLAQAELTREEILGALDSLVLADQTVGRIGRAASSRKATLVYGASGNGKTTAVRALGEAVGGTILIPYALELVGQIVHLYDPSKHVLVPDAAAGEPGLMRSREDRRWAEIRRPSVWAGGELTRHSLELMYDESTKVYEAPLQLKANGGTLIIDDFGRQQIPAVQLLNRWIVALEGGLDHLTLHTGQTVEVPFDVLVLFSTNLQPDRLADEAFLRRIRYKVEIPNPTEDEYRAIFREECASRGLRYDDAVVTHLLQHWYEAQRREMRGCHPRDVVEAIVDAAQYEKRPAEVTVEAVDEACATYFLRPMNAPA